MSGPADNTDRCPTCSMMPHVHGCTPGKCRAPKTAPELPPEKWVLTSRGARPATTAEVAAAPTHPLPWRWTDHDGDALLDGNGRVMLVLAHAGPVAPHVRAVTERSGAMEALLRRLLEAEDLRDEMGAVRKLVGEIDAAAKGGNG